MDFKILGPLEVEVDDRPLTLGGTKQRALLALLLIHANEVVSSDRLIEELWGDRPPEAAPKALQVAVSRLRRALEPERAQGQSSALLVTRSPGYELRLERGQLDLHRFDDQVAAGRKALSNGDPARALERLDAALDLWRGPPLSDLAYELFAQSEAGRLEELRSAVIEDQIAAELELGRHSELVPRLQELVRREPLRERLREQLMTALYGCGRQADALAAFQDARRTLVEELGIEPGPGLRELHERILRQDPGLDERPARAPGVAGDGEPERSRGVFVGRERELAELGRVLENALTGRGGVALVAGEPGIGKSKLATELVRLAQSKGARVLIGRCWEAGGAPAYWPWVQSMRLYIRDSEPDELRAQLNLGTAALAQLLPELHELYPDLPEPPALESEGARFRLFEAVSSFLRAASRDRPLLIVLDDLHAADEPSLLLLRFVAREIEDSRLLLVCAFRDVDPALQDPLSGTLADLAREGWTTRLGLTGLTEPDVAEYLELTTGTRPSPALVRAIAAETEGNPLFVTEVVRLLEAEGPLTEGDLSRRIPPGVRAVIGQRVARLSEPCRRLLVGASVLGRELELDVLGRLSDLERDELLDRLDEAMTERVMSVVPGSPGQLRFGHALIRDTLYDELTPARRLQLHRQAGAALESAHSADVDSHLTELAHHFVAAAPAGQTEKAVEYAGRAGDRAAAQLAYEEAARLYELALTLVDEPVERGALLLSLGRARVRAGDTPASKRAFREAAELADSGGETRQLVQAALEYGVAGAGIIWDVSRDDEYLVPLLDRALEALGDADDRLRVRLLGRLAGGPLRDASFPPERRRALSTEALEIAHRLGDPATVAYALESYILSHHSPPHTPKQLELATELVEVAEQAGDKERLLHAHDERFDSLLELGDADGARAELEIMEALAQQLRTPPTDWLVQTERAMMALLEGRFADAEVELAEAFESGQRALGWNAEVVYGLQLYGLRREQGRLEEMEDLVRRSAAAYPTYWIWRCILAHLAAALGQEAEALETFDGLAANDFAALPFDEEWLVSMCVLAQTVSALGDGPRAALVYPRLQPYGDRVAVSYPEVTTGSIARDLGLLAATMGRRDDAVRHFEHALEANERIGARPWLAHTRRDLARALDSRGAAGDQELARALRAQALAAYRELGISGEAA